MVFLSPTLTPISCSSKPGMNRPWPRKMAARSSAPPSKALAVDLAEVGDGQPVAILGGGTFLTGHIGTGTFGDLGQALFDFRISNLDHRTLDGDGVDRRQLESRHDLVGNIVSEIEITRQDLFRILVGERDLRLHRRLLGSLFEGLVRRFADHVVDDLGHGRLAIELLEVSLGNLARAEAADLGAPLEVLEIGIELFGEFGGRDDNLELALQAFGRGFSHLHGCFLSSLIPRTPHGPFRWFSHPARSEKAVNSVSTTGGTPQKRT